MDAVFILARTQAHPERPPDASEGTFATRSENTVLDARSDHPVPGRGLLGELRDRGPIEHGALRGPDMLPDDGQGPRRGRPPWCPRGLLGPVDRPEDLSQGD